VSGPVRGLGLPGHESPRSLIEAAVDGRPLRLKQGGDMRIDRTYIDDLVAGTFGAIDYPKHPFDVCKPATCEAPTVQ